jgi:hypothetical protein
VYGTLRTLLPGHSGKINTPFLLIPIPGKTQHPSIFVAISEDYPKRKIPLSEASLNSPWQSLSFADSEKSVREKFIPRPRFEIKYAGSKESAKSR